MPKFRGHEWPTRGWPSLPTALVQSWHVAIAFRKRTRYAFFCGVPVCLLCCLLLNKTENPKWIREENTICLDWIFKDSWTYAVKLIRR